MNDKSGNILVVDDNEMNRDMLSRRLIRRGHSVLVAKDGSEAIELVKENHFDVFLLDIMMPEIDGLEVLKILRKDFSVADLPIIMVTAKDGSSDVVQALEYGANDYVTKPIDFAVLLARLQTQISFKRLKETKDQFLRIAPDGIVTLMFSDMEGFTPMTERLGDEEAYKVIQAHRTIIREQLAAHEGYEVEVQGDGFLLAFGTARRGLQCAVAIQRDFAARNDQQPDQPIRVRMGLHAGEPIKEGDRFFGKTVILAARIAAQARGGEVLVSSLLKQMTEADGDVEFDDGRDVELKGLAGSHRLYLLRWDLA